MAARYVRDVEAPGSNPGSPTFTTNLHQPSLMQNAQPNDSSFSEIDSLQRAARELTAIIEVNPTDANAYYQRGVVYGQLVEPLAAIRDFDQVVRLDPTNAEAYYNRGSGLRSSERTDAGGGGLYSGRPAESQTMPTPTTTGRRRSGN